MPDHALTAAEPEGGAAVCKMPDCDRPVKGPRAVYCDDPKHNAQAYQEWERARQRAEARAARRAIEDARADRLPPEGRVRELIRRVLLIEDDLLRTRDEQNHVFRAALGELAAFTDQAAVEERLASQAAVVEAERAAALRSQRLADEAAAEAGRARDAEQAAAAAAAAAEAARREAEQAQREAQRQRDAAAGERDTAIQDRHDTHLLNEQLAAQNVELTKRTSELSQANGKLDHELTRAYEDLDRQTQELSQERGDTAKLRRLVADLEKDLGVAQARQHDQETRIEVLDQMLEEARERAAQAAEDAAAAAATRDAATAAQADTAAALQAAQRQIGALQARIAASSGKRPSSKG